MFSVSRKPNFYAIITISAFRGLNAYIPNGVIDYILKVNDVKKKTNDSKTKGWTQRLLETGVQKTHGDGEATKNTTVTCSLSQGGVGNELTETAGLPCTKYSEICFKRNLGIMKTCLRRKTFTVATIECRESSFGYLH